MVAHMTDQMAHRNSRTRSTRTTKRGWWPRRVFFLVTCLLAAGGWQSARGEELKSVPTLPAGTKFNDAPPEGWSNIVLFVSGRLASGDVSAAPTKAHEYASMFNLVILADVRKREDGFYNLQRYGVGFSTKVDGVNTVITIDTAKELGVDLSMIGRSVFAANEESLGQIKEVARFSTCALIDAPTIMLYEGEHILMTVRYLIWASRTTGQLSTFAWLLDRTAETGDYQVVEPALQKLPDNMREDRVMNVLKSRFLFGIPSKDAFALVRIPQGQPVKFTERLQTVAGAETFDNARFRELLEALTEASQQTQQAQLPASALAPRK